MDLLDENGEIIDDVIVMHMADGLYWVSDLYGPRLLPWIEQHKGEADIHAKIITYDWDMYAVQGPDSLKAMNAMLDAPVDDLKRFGICERKLGDIPVYIHRSGFTGENGELTIACEGGYEPFSYVNEDGDSGYDVDFVYRFCREYGYTPNIQRVAFESIAPGAESGKYDIGMNIILSDERAAAISSPRRPVLQRP